MAEKFKKFISDHNVQLYAVIALLFGGNAFIDRYSIYDFQHTYSTIMNSPLYLEVESLRTQFSIMNAGWGIVFIILFLISMFLLEGRGAGKLTKGNKFLLLPFTAIFALSVVLSASSLIKVQNYVIENLTVESTRVDITLDTLTGAEKNLENALIYVDKEGCGECKEASVVIDNIGKAYDMPIYHYNTIYDTDDNMEELKQVLEGYKITSVPAVVLIKNGKYETTFYSEEIKTDKVQIYLKENSDFFTKK